MKAEQLLEALPKLQQYLSDYEPHMGRLECREHLARYSRGQLGPLERKSLEPMALAESINPRRLQMFFFSDAWDDEGVLRTLQHKVVEAMGSDEAVFVHDETSDAKKGRHTAGVARQYCGETGKIDNCIVMVQTAYVSRGMQALLDSELFLPDSWDPDSKEPDVMQRRKRAKIPEGERHRSKARMAIEQLRRARQNDVPGRWVVADEHYGKDPWYRQQIQAMGLWFVVEIPSNSYGWIVEPAWHVSPRRSTMGAPPTRLVPNEPARKVKDLAQKLDQPWQPYQVKDTTKGPELWEVRETPFWLSRSSGTQAEGPCRLLVARHVVSSEIKYFLSNAALEVEQQRVISVGFMRSAIERIYEDCKGELGMNHAEMRSWPGIHRHLLLTAVNYLFLVLLCCSWKKKRARAEPQSAGRCDPEAA